MGSHTGNIMDHIQKDILKMLQPKVMELQMYESMIVRIKVKLGWEHKTNLEVVMEFCELLESGNIEVKTC